MRVFRFILFSILLLGICSPAFPQNVPGYSISVKIVNCKGGEQLFLQQYRGRNLSNIDSLVVTADKNSTFHRNHSLQPGMYALSLNKTLLANFFISNKNNQNFIFSLDTQNPAQTLTFTGSPENQAFVDYLRFLGTKQHSQAEIKLKGEQLQKQFPGSMLALFIQTMKEPEVPEPTKPVSDPIEYKYSYLANHYFDNIDFSDKRLLNTPLLEQKLGFYFKQMVPPLPDSITERVDETLGKANANAEVYNRIVRYLYNLYREAPIEGNTEVYNFIGENYIITEPDRWNDSVFVGNVNERVSKARLNPVGEKAANLVLQTPEGKTQDLYSINAPFTVLFFFNPGCEACRPVSETLLALYRKYHNKGLEVFAVYVDKKKEEWLDYIKTKGLDWQNVFDPTGAANIERQYDIFAIPLIYLLDKDKKIVAKDLPAERMEEYLKR